MSHTCPECGQYCTCDGEDLEQDAPANCMHACDTELEDAYDDWEPGLPAPLAPEPASETLEDQLVKRAAERIGEAFNRATNP